VEGGVKGQCIRVLTRARRRQRHIGEKREEEARRKAERRRLRGKAKGAG